MLRDKTYREMCLARLKEFDKASSRFPRPGNERGAQVGDFPD
jgi:hypothetical protein